MLVLKHVAPSDAFGVVFLRRVLVISTEWGFGVAAITSVISVFAFDYFRMWPDGFNPTAIENWVAVVVFLFVALVANTVAYLARARAGEADRHMRAGLDHRRPTPAGRAGSVTTITSDYVEHGRTLPNQHANAGS